MGYGINSSGEKKFLAATEEQNFYSEESNKSCNLALTKV